MNPMLEMIRASVTRFIFPQLCALCDDEVTQAGLCASCWSDISLISDMACAQCATPFGHQQLHAICGNCLKDPPTFDHAAAAMTYNDGSRQLLLRFKHGDRQDIAPVLANMMAPATLPMINKADFILPLPLHRTRLLARRFNQSAELCRFLLQRTPEHQHKYNTHILLRHKRTPPQGHKTKAQRRNAMAGAFNVPADQRPMIKGKHILIIDDVMTTGASLSSAANTLKRAGAGIISVAVVARVC